jgi:4-hydroxybenzoate polyprenyltransferase
MKVNSLDKTTASTVARDLAISLRPRVIILSWIIYSCVVIASNGLEIGTICLGLILFIAMYGIVALQNDLSDIKTDKINRRRDIPYSTGKLTDTQLMRMMLVLSGVATLTGFILSYHVLPWVGLYLVLGFLYSGPLDVKSRGVYAALLLGFCYGAMPWLIGASVTSQLDELALLSMAFTSFVFSSGIIVIKDFKDLLGDKATHKNTLLVRKGAPYTRRYYLLTTSLAYCLLLAYSCMTHSDITLVVMCLAMGFVDYWLLETKSIFTSSTARSTRGRWARILFFTSALAVYFATTVT